MQRLFDSKLTAKNDTLVCSSISWSTTADCCQNRISNSAQNATTAMKGACLWTGNETQWDSCVQKLGILHNGVADPDIAVNGTDGGSPPAGASKNQDNITYVVTAGDKHDPSSAPKDNSVLFSTIDAEKDASLKCCDKADKYWRRFAELWTPSSGACIFHKDEAEKKNIYEEYWKPCIESYDAYPARLDNVTGQWSAGFTNRASAGLLVAAAALALLA